MTEVLANTAQQAVSPRLEGEQLESAVLKQIEYYFSRQNLATDAYLVSQMDSDMWVPISTIAGFKKVHMLTTDVDLIVRVMSKSSAVTVDTTRMAIKPSWKLQRNTLILRDIPSDAPEDEVRQLFGTRPVTGVHSDIGDTWFVTFATEDDALDALMNINTILFREKPVKARVKAEHLLKSSAVVQPYPQPYMIDPAAAYQAYRAYPSQYAPRVPYGQPQPYWEGQQAAAGADAGKPADGRRSYRGRRDRAATSPHGGGQAQPPATGGRPRGNSQGQGQAPFKGDPNAVAAAGASKSRRKGKKGSDSKPATGNGVHPSPSVIVPLLNQQHFPSLPSPSNRLSKASFMSGYTTDFRKFTKDDLLRIINTVQDVTTRPATVIAAEPGVVEQKPNTDLEIAHAPPTPDPSSIPEVLDLQLPPAAVALVPSAPGLAVREWPLDKRASPAPAAPAQVFVPKKAQPTDAQSTPAAASPTPTPASAPASASQPVQSPPAQAPAPSTPQPASLRKSAEQTAPEKENTVPSSPSLNSSDGLRKSTYADIALAAARTNSPPIPNGKSPSLPPSSPSPNLPPAPAASLEGKPQ